MNTMPATETNYQPAQPTATSPRRNLRTLLPNLLINWLLPLLAYQLISPHVRNDLIALAISSAIPALITIGTYLFRRRVNVIGLIGVAGFAIGLAVSVLTGGDELVFKLQEPVLTGTIGLIFLGSVAIGRPLFLLVHRMMNRAGTATPVDRHRAGVLSTLLGTTLLVHGVVIAILALTLPTGTFLALSRPVGLPILAIGTGVLFWYGRRSPSVSRQGN